MSTHVTSFLQQLLLSQFVQNVSPLLLTSAYNAAGSYFRPRPTSPTAVAPISPEQELERMQMTRLLKWMEMMFEEYEIMPPQTEETPSSVYRQELYSLFKGIRSDYHEYTRWKTYNDSLWLLSSYRQKNIYPLAKKILADLTLFREGLQMFSGRL